LRGRTLMVAVSSAPWMQELQLLKRTVLTELNAQLGTPLVADLFFVLTSLPDRPPVTEPTEPATLRRACPPAPHTQDLSSLPEPLRACFDDITRAWRRRADR
jgi:predicted nucleic acid-binding Zn ribbon protein